MMITDRLRKVIEEMTALAPDEQGRLAAAIQTILRQSPITSDMVRPEVMASFEDIMGDSQAVLDDLRAD